MTISNHPETFQMNLPAARNIKNPYNFCVEFVACVLNLLQQKVAEYQAKAIERSMETFDQTSALYPENNRIPFSATWDILGMDITVDRLNSKRLERIRMLFSSELGFILKYTRDFTTADDWQTEVENLRLKLRKAEEHYGDLTKFIDTFGRRQRKYADRITAKKNRIAELTERHSESEIDRCFNEIAEK